MTVYILYYIFHVIIYGPRVCNKHLNNEIIVVFHTCELAVSLSLVTVACKRCTSSTN